jgi:uncharacterized damage-inducible protein DinB
MADPEGAVARIADEIERGYRGDPWHGGSTREILDGVDSATATRHPIPGAHSIAEIVAHLTAWTREVARRLDGKAPAIPAEGNWPPPAGPTTGEWQAALIDLERAHDELLAALRRFPATQLQSPMGTERHQALGTGLSFELVLHGLGQHLAYHTGQIALLKKEFK